MQVIMKVKQRKHLQQQEKIMTNIVIYGICQEMHVNGPQNTLPALAVATSTLVFIVEGITTQLMVAGNYTSYRYFSITTDSYGTYGLRPLLYVK